MKKKNINLTYGTKISGLTTNGGINISRGPHTIIPVPSISSFSINGGSRSKGWIGQEHRFSKARTPYYNNIAKGNGGNNGKYNTQNQVFVNPIVKGITSGQEFKYIKPSVLSNYGMLKTKYKWITRPYPNFWVQPVYPNGSLCDNSSQQVYIDKKAAANVCVTDVNNPIKYVDYKVQGNPATNCHTTPARKRGFNIMSSSSGYTKTIYQPQTASQQTLRIQRKCSNPLGIQKPFPFATNGGSGNSGKGINYAPPPISQLFWLTPPSWYAEDTTTNINKTHITLPIQKV